MKKTLLASIAVAAFFSAPALAADYPMKAPPADVFNWSGWYIGGNAGWQHSEDKWAFDPPVVGGVNQTYTVKGDHAIFGGQLGFNVQAGNWLWGVELAGSGNGEWSTRSQYGINPAFDSQTRVTNIWTLGPRLGFVNGQSMIYGTGGFAAAEVSSQAVLAGTNMSAGGAFATNMKWVNGWFIGGGVEYALTHHWILGAEYQYVALNKELFCASAGNCPVGAAGFNNRDITGRENIVRARLSYLFNSSR
jgi:outer membrane immunogenic protein